MPVFEYECASCGSVFELLVNKISSRDKQKCPDCKSSDVSRKLSAFAVNEGSKKLPAGGCPSGSCGYDPGSCSAGGCCGV
ncbi:MAG: FmdB family zinc ribbon protein [Fibrobacterota bacterium]